MAKISDTSGSSNIWLGSKQNSRQTILYVPASSTAGSDTTDKPGLLFLEAVDNAGTIQTGLYLWADSAGALRYSATYPTNEDGSGTALGAATGASLALDNLATVQINTSLLFADALQDVGDDPDSVRTLYWNTSLKKIGTTWDVTLTATEPAAASYTYTFPDAAADANVMLDTGAATAITYTKSTANITLGAAASLDIGAAGTLDVGTGAVAFAGTAAFNLATTKTVNIDEDVTIQGGALTTSTAVTLDQDVQASASPTWVGLTLSGAIATPTNITMSGYLLMSDDQQIRLGAVGATDSYIEYDTATDDLIFYDRNQTGSITLSQLYSGTPLSPIVTGDLTISDGQFDWTNTAGTADVSLWTFANSTTDPIHIVANSITSGSIIKIESSISAQAGYYLECYDGTNQDFLVGDAGAVTIFGVAGSTVHTITSGDAVIADGSLAITDNDDAAALTIINNTITTGDLISVTADAMTSGSMLYLDNAVGATFSGMYIQCFDGAANDFDVKLHGVTTIAGVASGTDALTLTAGDIKLTAGLVELTLGNVLLTDGMVTADTIQNLQSYVKRNSASAAAPAFVVENTHATGTGYAMLITQDANSGASGGLSITNKGTSPILSLAAGAARTGYVVHIPMANQLAERALLIDGASTVSTNEGAIEVSTTGVLAAGANLLRLVASGNQAADSYIMEIVASGTPVGATSGFALLIDDNTGATGTSYAVDINANANEALQVSKGKVKFAETMRAVGVQSSASAHTTHATAGSGTSTVLAGESFIDVTSGGAAEIIVLPVPVLGDIIVLKANAATAFELRTQANTQFINGTVTTADEELLCAAADTIVASCVVGGASGKWIVVKYDAAGTPAAGGTPD